MNFRWILPLIVLFEFSAQADPLTDGFYQYTDEAGVVSLTDNLKQVPARYKSQVTQRTWAELATEVETRWTSLNSRIASASASGMNRPVKNWRWAGTSLPHPWRIKVILVRCSSGVAADRAYDPYSIR